METVTATVTNVSAAYADVDNARNAVQTKTSILTQQESVLDGELTRLGAYVDSISGGDETIIRSAGMDIQKEKTPSGTPDKVLSVNATIGDNTGEIDISWDRVDYAKSYVVEIAVTATVLEWKHILVTTKSKAELYNLQSGVSYQIRVAAVGAAGQGHWSDSVTKTAP